ncbi:MAG TPA: helix-turn-helix domain-containing protein [Ilumatobacteraceae bacterium]|nr:helix-turn-helix domain-containing protein [Ilumatobacteraceae bacterium]
MGARAEATEATRARILDTTFELVFELSYDELTLREVADRAGVSFQTVLRHFGTKDGLIAAVAESRTGDEYVRRVARPGDAADAAAVLCARYEEIADGSLHWEMLEDRVEAVGVGIRAAREGHRAWLGGLFADALAPLPATGRSQLLLLLVAATDINTWRLWRRRLGLSASDTQAAMVSMMEAALEHARSATREQQG